MGAVADRLEEEAKVLSAADFKGTIHSYYPFWDAQYRPNLIEAVRHIPAEHFDFKPRPEMLTASQVVLHIAETERWWIHHIVDGEPYMDFTTRHADPAQGWITVYDAPDHNALLFPLEEYHRGTQRWMGKPASELSRVVRYSREGAPDRSWTLHWILDHVQEHEIHHRAQLNIYLRLLGLEPPSI